MRQLITLEAIKVIETIDKKGSFSAAAESLFKVPSALSYTVKQLEEDLNISIFDRSKQRARLTPAGHVLVEQGRLLLRAAQELEDAVMQVDSGWERRLSIALDAILSIEPLLEVIKQFQQLNKQVDIDISEEVLGGTWDALMNDRCDLAIGASGELPKGVFELLPIGQVDFVFAVSAEHPLKYHDGPIDANALQAFPSIVAGDSSLTSPGRSMGLLPSRQTVRVANNAAKVLAQIMGVGVGFLPRHQISRHLDNGELVELECSFPRPQVPLYMAWRKATDGKALKWFIQACAEVDWLALVNIGDKKE